jgi:hypothetical protein
MLGLDYSSSDDETGTDVAEGVGKDVAVDERCAAPAVKSATPTEALPSAAAMFSNDAETVGLELSSRGVAGATSMVGTKRAAPTPVLNTRPVQQKYSKSFVRINTLLPPQLKGRANKPTQDLEGIGIQTKKKTPTRK